MDRDEKVRRARRIYEQWVAASGGRNQRDEEIRAARREAEKREAEERKRRKDEENKRGYWQHRSFMAPSCRWVDLAYLAEAAPRPGAELVLPASVVLARQREAEREQAEKLRRAKELYKQWTDDGNSHDRGRARTLKP